MLEVALDVRVPGLHQRDSELARHPHAGGVRGEGRVDVDQVEDLPPRRGGEPARPDQATLAVERDHPARQTGDAGLRHLGAAPRGVRVTARRR